jgi:hypothetical protein
MVIIGSAHGAHMTVADITKIEEFRKNLKPSLNGGVICEYE